jgi:hypothetical protein
VFEAIDVRGQFISPQKGDCSQYASIFFVYAYRVLDGRGLAGAVYKGSVHVVYGTLAVTSQAERVGHITASVFAQVEGMFSLVRVFRVPIWDDHFSEGETPEGGPLVSLVVEGDVRQDDTFAVVESYVVSLSILQEPYLLLYLPMCNFQFCQLIVRPSIEKETPSSCVILMGFMSVLKPPSASIAAAW